MGISVPIQRPGRVEMKENHHPTRLVEDLLTVGSYPHATTDVELIYPGAAELRPEEVQRLTDTARRISVIPGLVGME